ncbi:transposase [Streptomyces nigrescens]|uniref:Transposase n=1 Tax=Streptomyces nigrescens TaxID=1920 RepID=A0ABY7JDQ5_STRNI|nr:transposase [Streptomyces nigrescens]WAU09478.1 transposase [Streptomyces nigrescens]
MVCRPRLLVVLADGGYQGTGTLIPHRRRRRRRRRQQERLTPEQEADNAVHRRARAARVEHVFSWMKIWKILRGCRLRGAGVRHAMLGVARLHNLALSG